MHKLITKYHANLEASEERLRLALDATSDGAWDYDVPSDTAVYSAQWLERHGYRDEDARGNSRFWQRLIHPDDRQRVLAALAAHLRGQTDSFEAEYRIRLGTDEYSWTLDRGKVVAWDKGGKPIRMVGTNKNIDDRVKARQALIESELLNRTIVENSSECIKLLDCNGQIIFMNGPGMRALELESFADVKGKYWPDLWPLENRDVLANALADAVVKPQQFVGFCPTANGKAKWWDVGVRFIISDPTGIGSFANQAERYLVTSRDITESRTFSEQLQRAAYYDAVTELPNRRLFHERFRTLIERAEKERRIVAPALFDIDNFRQVNDTLGTHAGDLLLQDFAERIRSNIRKSDLEARLGEDEFAVVLSDASSADEIMTACHSIATRLDAPFVYDGHAIDCRASCGVITGESHTEKSCGWGGLRFLLMSHVMADGGRCGGFSRVFCRVGGSAGRQCPPA